MRLTGNISLQKKNVVAHHHISQSVRKYLNTCYLMHVHNVSQTVF